MILAGVDIETTGTDPDCDHRLIQIGITLGVERSHAYDVQPIGPIAFTPIAMEINGFTLARILAALPQHDVDVRLSNTLKSYGCTKASVVPVGWNVGVFDMPFIKKELPLTADLFMYGHDEISTKTLDLNSLALFYEYKTGKSYKDLKDRIKVKVAELLGGNREHDALYDAEAALIALSIFKEVL